MENNNKQNIEIAELKIEVKNLKEKFDAFISNDFQHLREEVRDLKKTLFNGFVIGISVVVLTQIVLAVMNYII